MNKLNSKIDAYLATGCGRCPRWNTPECKVHNWPEELEILRGIILNCGLTEKLKWGVPCYTFQIGDNEKESNIAILAAFKEYVALSFFKGALLKDPYAILVKPGENTQSARLIRFTDVQKIKKMETYLTDYINEAIEVEKAGLKPKIKKTLEPIPEEFQSKLDEIPQLKSAFNSLTAGRQRGYILHFSQSKQSETRSSRVQKCIPKILKGLGINDR